jgi:hypothetical protein
MRPIQASRRHRFLPSRRILAASISPDFPITFTSTPRSTISFNIHDLIAEIEAPLGTLKTAFTPEIKAVQKAEHDVVNAVAQPDLNDLKTQLGDTGVKGVQEGVAAADRLAKPVA